MADRPVGVVRQGIDGLDGHHRTFEGRHAIERQGHDQETQDRVIAQFVPCARQGHDAVDHAAPAGGQQNQRKDHADRLGPVRQGGVMQVVRAGPHVSEDQGPEVHDRQAVRIHGTLCLLGNEVIHHAQEASGQEETHGVVAIPPLHHGVLHTGIGRIRLESAHGQCGTVDQVQQGHRDDERPKEPVGHVNVSHLARAHGAKENDGETDPHQGDQNVNGPLQLSVFLALGVTQRQRNGRSQDDQLPAPKGERRQLVAEQTDVAGALHDVISRRKQAATAKRKNNRIGVQGAQAAIAEPWNAQIQLGPGQLGRDDHANQHAHHTPNHRHDGELAHNGVVVRSRLHIGKFHFHLFFFKNCLRV